MKIKTGILISVTLVLLIFLSGCTGFPDIFGRDVLDIQNVVTRDKTTDAMAIKDILTIPTSPMLPDQGVMLSFIVENKDDLKSLKSVIVDLYNAPLFKNANGDLCNLYSPGNPAQCLPEENKCTKNVPCTILAGEEKPITYRLMTPSQDEIVNIRTQEKLDFRVKYDFDGSMLYTVPVVNMDEIINRQRQGERTQVQISKAHGSGPIQVDVELFGAPYILSGYSATFLFKVQNKGSGVLAGRNEIGKDNLLIEFPAELVNGKIIAPGDDTYEFTMTQQNIFGTTIGAAITGKTYLCEYNQDGYVFECTNIRCVADKLNDEYDSYKECMDDCDYAGVKCKGVTTTTESERWFDCEYISDENVVLCKNIKPIPIYKDETRASLRFEVPLTPEIVQPFKSYEIRAKVVYTYEMRNSVDVVINPFGNV